MLYERYFPGEYINLPLPSPQQQQPLQRASSHDVPHRTHHPPPTNQSIITVSSYSTVPHLPLLQFDRRNAMVQVATRDEDEETHGVCKLRIIIQIVDHQQSINAIFPFFNVLDKFRRKTLGYKIVENQINSPKISKCLKTEYVFESSIVIFLD